MAIKDWSTQYPTNLDTSTQQPAVVDNADVTRATQINTMRNCVQGLQAQVGSNNLESGSLRERVGALETPVVQTGITAFAGGGQGSATQLSAATYFHFVDTVTSPNDSVKLPDNGTGQAKPRLVKNRGVSNLAVFPFLAGAIDALGVNVAFTLRPNMQQWFVPLPSGGGWASDAVSDQLNLTGSALIGTTLGVTGNVTNDALTASQAVFSNGSKVLVSTPVTGTGNVVMSASPTLTGTALLASLTASGTASLNRANITEFSNRSVDDNVTAFSGGGQASATLIAAPVTVVKTAAAHNDSVKLPTGGTIGDLYYVINKTAFDVAVYPHSGGDVGENGTNNPSYLCAEGRQGYILESTNQWRLHGYSMFYIDRGDPASTDITYPTMTADGNFYEWDVSSIIPRSGWGKPALMTMRLQSTAVGEGYIRTDGNTNQFNMIICRNQVANDNSSEFGMVKVSSAGKVEYRLPTTTSTASIRIHGWWVVSAS